MAIRSESRPTSSLATNRPNHESMGTRIVPISISTTPTPIIKMSAPGSGEPMELSSPTNSAPGHTSQNSDSDANGNSKSSDGHKHNQHQSNSSSSMPAPPPAAAAAVHQPKIVQTAFIHKLYNMLEDPNIQHLISWSSTADSFVMSPSADFSKVLSQYFKHTNISSFVRQLNMYGFHKERDVFHTGNPDTTLWEFKHGGGNFKRGDLVGLREIKRRASRHALVHRESSYGKTTSQPGTPAEPVPMAPESVESRLASMDHAIYDLANRLARSEDTAHYMHVRNHAMLEGMSRLLSINHDLSRTILSLVPSDSQASRDIASMQTEIQRQTDMMRSLEEPPEPPYIGRQHYFSGVENAPISPRQMSVDDPRRGNTLAVPQARGQNFYRPPVPSNLSISTRRPYGSISGSSTTQSSPLRVAPPPPPPQQPHPLSQVESPPGSLTRRHTSADIRDHGWQPAPSPFASGAPSSQWPSSPSRVPNEEQRIRDSLSTYSLQTDQHGNPHSRPATPPPPFANGQSNPSDTFGSWNWGSAASRDGKSLFAKDHSAPPTRRGSMAHILNPSDTAERSDEDEDPRGDDDRKRKRLG